MNNNVKRYEANINVGLTSEQVTSRLNDGLYNFDTTVKTKSIKEIIISNVFTLFNLINIILGILVFIVGSIKNVLFLGVIFCNILIGIIQEIRSKKIIDKLSIISSTKSTVLRNGKKVEVDINNIVLDDIIIFELGNQIVVDSYILNGSVEVNESFITGEADTVIKKSGDLLLSGSFIVSGGAICRVEHIGYENYTSTISSEAKYIKKVNSEIMNSLNKIIKIISYFIFPLGILLFLHQMSIDGNSINNAIINTVAAIIGMIPEGLVLLTSTVLAVSVIRISKYNCLVQDLFSIETLSRVDTLCLDKTGTLTEGILEVIDVYIYNNNYNIKNILSSMIGAFDYFNSTLDAIKDKYGSDKIYKAQEVINFSSERKYSAVHFMNEGTFVLGAPEIILKNIPFDLKEKINANSKYRILLLGKTTSLDIQNTIPIALIFIKDKIRNSASETLKYFYSQGVDIKIISGDNPLTVASVASECGLSNINYIDARTLLTDNEIKCALNKYNIFGRVTPAQKKKIIISLKELGHTVAMVGDGVNDVLALKESDCSVALANGSDATRNVSQFELLDSNFSSMPKVVLEGRRTINNIERSATLFLVKTIYSFILCLLFIFINKPYPFVPIQLTLTSVLTIGIPSFVLALEPNNERIKGNFLYNVIASSLPTALTIVFNIIIIMVLSSIFKFSVVQSSTLCVILTGFTGFTLLYHLCKPFNIIRFVLFFSNLVAFIFGIIGLRNLFSLSILNVKMIIIITILMVITYLITLFFNNLVKEVLDKKRKDL